MFLPCCSFFGKANNQARSLEGDVERLQANLLRAQRALKSAETLQVRVQLLFVFMQYPAGFRSSTIVPAASGAKRMAACS